MKTVYTIKHSKNQMWVNLKFLSIDSALTYIKDNFKFVNEYSVVKQ